MANLATINNNLLADSGIDPLDLIVGTGTVNYIPKFTAEGTIANSALFESGGALLIGTTSTTNTAAGKIVNRVAGTSDPDLALNGGAWSIASIGGEPALYLSSNIVAATGLPSASQTAKGGIGFEYVSAAAPTDLILGIFGAPTVASSVRIYNNTERIRIASTGAIRFNAYGSGTFTGTRAYDLSVDASGNIIEVPVGAGTVTGSGSAGQVAYWSSASAITGESALFYNDTNNWLGIGGTPQSALHITNTAPFIYLDDSSTSGTLKRMAIKFGDVGADQTLTFAFDNTSGTANKDVLSINELGRVGINTTAPAMPLEVRGASTNSSQDIASFIGANASNETKGLYIRLVAGTPQFIIRTGAVSTDSSIAILPNGVNGLTIPYGTTVASFSNSLTVGDDLSVTDKVGIGGSIGTDQLFVYNAMAKVAASSGWGVVVQDTNVDGAAGRGGAIAFGAYRTDSGRFNVAAVAGAKSNSTGTNENGDLVLYSSVASSLTERQRIASNGAIRFNAYGSGSFTGTVAYNLAVDSSGNIIETAGGVVDGSGTANRIPKWSDPNTLTDANITDNGSIVRINTIPLLSDSRVGIGTEGNDQTYASLFIGGALTTGTDQSAIVTDPQLAGTNNYAIQANARIKASHAATNAFGVYILNSEKLSGATIVNNYGLYIANQTSGSSQNYSIYSAGGLNYFGSNSTFAASVGIGASPTKRLYVYDATSSGTDDIAMVYQALEANHAWYRSQRINGANMVIGATRNSVDNSVPANSSIVWNQTNHNMVFGTNNLLRFTLTSGGTLNYTASVTASSAIARGIHVQPNLIAAANNDVLYGIDIRPTYDFGSYADITRIPFRAQLADNRWIEYKENIFYAKFNDNTNVTPLVLENAYGLGYAVGILFNLGYDGTGSSVGTTVAGGRLYISPEGSWTSTTSTQDASMIFQVAQNGVLGNGLTITSGKTVKLNGYTTNGYVKTSGSDGTLIIDTTNDYITGTALANQVSVFTGPNTIGGYSAFTYSSPILSVGLSAASNQTDYKVLIQRHGTLSDPGTWTDSNGLQVVDYAADGPAAGFIATGLVSIELPRIATTDTYAGNAVAFRVANDNLTIMAVKANGNTFLGQSGATDNGERLQVLGNVSSKSTGNYGGFIADNSSSATIGGGYFTARSFGVTRGAFAVAGAMSGTEDNNIALFAEGGTGMGSIKFMVNGSATPAFIMTSTGRLGINESGPSSRMQINGDIRISGAGSAIDGYAGGFLDFSSDTLIIRGQATTGGGISLRTSANGAANVATERVYISPAGNVTVGSGYLVVSGVTYANSRLMVGTNTGDQNYASIFVGGAITSGTSQYAILCDPQLAGTTASYAVFANARIKANTAVASAFGVYIPTPEKLSGATITDSYALYIANQTSGSSTNYSIYSSGGLNYFGGSVGIGVVSPNRVLDVDGVIRTRNAGSAGAPSIELGTSAQGNGLFYPTTNTIAIATNDAERIRVSSGGNVQISTNNVALVQTNAAGTGTIGIARVTSGNNLQIGDGGTANPTYVYFPNGSVGINTTTVNAKLQINDSSIASGGSGLWVYGYDGAANLYTTRGEAVYNTALYLYNNPSAGQGYGTGISFRAKSDTVDSRAQGIIYTTWATATDASRTSNMVFGTTNAASSSDKMWLTGSGRLGVGQSNPSGTLHVTMPGITASAPSLGWPVYNAEGDNNAKSTYIDTGGNGSISTAGYGASVVLQLGQYYDSRVVITPTGSGGASPSDQGTGRGKDLMLKAGTSDNGAGYKGGRLYLNGGMGYGSAFNANGGDIIMQSLTGSGNVWVGLTSDIGGKLQVGGSVRAESFSIYRASAFRGGIYTYADISGSGTDRGIAIFAEGGTDNGNIYFCPNGSATQVMTVSTGSEVWIGYTSDQGAYKLQVNGNVLASGFFESSDVRLKTIINRHQSFDFDAIEYNWNDGRDSKLHWGYVAQEVMKFLPDAVSGTEESFYTLDYNQVHTYKIAMLEKRIAELEQQLKNK